MAPEFKIGDFVKCNYDFMGFYDVFEQKALPVHPSFYGIVVGVREVTDWFGYEVLYEVLCTDGFTRSFCRWEMHREYP